MCEYCKPYNSNKELISAKTNVAYIYGGDGGKFLGIFNTFDDNLNSVRINYCPMCGRKLKELKNEKD